MKYFLTLLAFVFLYASSFAQGKVKVVEKRHENGKPEIIKYFIGQKVEKFLSKIEHRSIDGKVVREESYANGKLHGKVRAFKEFDGTKTLELNYVAGELSGEQFYYFSDGRPKRVLNYKGGRMDGRQIEYFFKKENDSLKIEHNYSGGVLHGMQRRWDKAGKLEYNLNFVAGKPDGIQRMYNEEGDKEETWKSGRLNEVLETWTAAQPRHVRMYSFKLGGDSMNIKVEKVFEKEVSYFESGSIQAVTEGGDDPVTKEYHPNGKLRGEGKGTLAKPVGKWVYNHLSGEKMMEGEYVKGKKSGLWQSWDAQGNLQSEEAWNPETGGRESWKMHFYHPNGKKASEGELDEKGRRKGMWKYWYANGNKQKEETWGKACDAGDGRFFVTELKRWDESEKLIAKGAENKMTEYTYHEDGNVSGVHTVVFPQRDPCVAGPEIRFEEGAFRTKGLPVNYDKKVVLVEISLLPSGDTLRIDRFNEAGERHGFQEGWFEDGKKQYEYHFRQNGVQGTVKEWYADGSPMLDHKYKSALGGPPKLVEGTYYNEKGKDYFFSDTSGKDKKKAMLEIDAACHFLKFVEEVKAEE